MWKQLWRPEVGFFLVIWLALLVTGRENLLRDPGTFWHTVVGDQILSAGEVPRTDTYSFTRHGQPWVAYQWLAECGMAVVHRLSGFDGLLLATVTLLAATYTWLAGRLLRAGLHWLITVLVIVLVIAASSYHFHIRPHLFTIAFLGVTFAWLMDVEAGRRPIEWLYLLIPLHFFWANMHGGVLAGMGIAGLLFGCWALLWFAGKRSPLRRPRDLVHLFVIGLGISTPILLNPYGLELPRMWAHIMLADLPVLIQEHAPPKLLKTEGLAVIALGMGYVLVLLGALSSSPRLGWFIPCVLFYLAMNRARHGPLFAITAGLALADMLPHSRFWARLSQGSDLLKLSVSPDISGSWRLRHLLIPASAVLLALGLQWANISIPLIGAGWARHPSDEWPNQLIHVLREQVRGENAQDQPSPGRRHIFNDMQFGAFLMYHVPDLPVFIDDRCELYVDGLLQAYDRTLRDAPEQLEVWQAEYNLGWALLKRGTVIDAHLRASKRWELIAECEAATLFRRRD
jgi:hypothetical protein